MSSSSTTQVPVGPGGETAPIPIVQAPPPPSRRRRPGRKSLIAVAVIIVLAAAAVGIWLATRKSSTAAALTVSTETVAVTTGNLQQTVASSGTIQPGEEAELNFGVSGQVNAVKV